MAITRRQFLKRSALAAAGVAASPYMRWVPGTNVSWAAGPTNKIVVIVQLNGGNDGLGTVYPLGPNGPGTQRGNYESIRPTLAQPDTDGGVASVYSSVFPNATSVLSVGQDIDGDEYALHPVMTRLHNIWNAGEMAICTGVHYPHSNHSHFRSSDIWYTGDPLGNGGQGWFGSYLDTVGFSPTDVPVVIMDNQLNPVFTPTTASLFAIKRLDNLVFPATGTNTEQSLKQAAIQSILGDAASLDPAVVPELVKIGQTGDATLMKMGEYYTGNGFPGDGNTARVEPLLLNSSGKYKRNNDLVYNSPLNGLSGGLARDLRHVAAIIRSTQGGNVGACYFHVDKGGFDTHSNQEKGFFHSSLWFEVSEAVGAFYEDMSQSISLPSTGGYDAANYRTGSLVNEVVIVTFSEFGRTMAQNAAGANTAGTDHAASAPQIVMGGQVQGGLYGPYPKLDDPSAARDNDLKYVFDVRDFYGTILNRWLGVSSGAIAGSGSGFIFPLTPELDDDGRNYTGYTPIPFLL